MRWGKRYKPKKRETVLLLRFMPCQIQRMAKAGNAETQTVGDREIANKSNCSQSDTALMRCKMLTLKDMWEI